MCNSVCLIVQNYYDNDPRVRRKAEALKSNGYGVDVIALKPKNRNGKNYEINGVKIYTIHIPKKRSSFFRYIFEYSFFFIVAAAKSSLMTFKKKYSVIDINTLPDFLVFSGLLPKLINSKIVLDMHEVMPEFYMSKYGLSPKHWLIRLIMLQEKLSFLFADRVMTINAPIQRLLEKRGLSAEKSIVLMNSADDTLYRPVRHSDNIYSKESEKFIMMYHGTLTSIYGLDIALKAFSLVQDDMPNAEFWIIGDGPEMDFLKNLANDLRLDQEVKFFGLIPQQDIPFWLSHCTIGVLPTRRDVFLDLSFSNKLSEFILMNKPAIVSRLKAIQTYFSENALLFFEPENPLDLSKKMFFLYSHVVERSNLSKKAKEEYSLISWDVMKKKYLGLIESLA